MAVKTAKQACEQLQGVEYFVDASNIVGRSVNDLVENDERFVAWAGGYAFGKHIFASIIRNIYGFDFPRKENGYNDYDAPIQASQ